jgi:hypothetical protein
MKTAHYPDASVKKLLDSLKQKNDDEVAVMTLKGRALSRSATSVHLATTAGIIAVPIANIKEVVSLNDAHADLVRVVVKNPKDIRQLLGVRPAWPTNGGGSGGGGAVAMEEGETVLTDRNPEKTYVGVGTYTTTDTDTVTGGQGNLDATDDREPTGGQPDDTHQ